MMTECNPMEIFHPSDSSNTLYGLIILNQPLDDFGTTLLNIWDKATIRAVTDGAINRLYSFLKKIGKNLDDFIPDFINGDFDSVNQEILNFYKIKGSEIISTPDQDHTDFTKCIQILLHKAKERDIELSHIVAVVNATGRFDHILGNVQTLFLVKKWNSIPVYLMSHDGLTWLVDKGKHTIFIAENLTETHCGLIPVGEPTDHVTTSGLKWNLYNHRLQFGELVSTSNTYDGSGKVTIENDTPLIWTMEMPNYIK